MEGDAWDGDDQAADYDFKIILVGNSGVGKTSITSRYVDNEFSEEQKRSKKVKIAHKFFTIPDTRPAKVADLHLWDTLGQEKFHAIADIFFKGSVGAIIVFDLSSRNSFDELDKWW